MYFRPSLVLITFLYFFLFFCLGLKLVFFLNPEEVAVGILYFFEFFCSVLANRTWFIKSGFSNGRFSMLYTSSASVLKGFDRLSIGFLGK